MSSIFNRIFRYRQSKHRTPSEDYFTETFVAVLDRCKPLRIAFVEWLIGSKNIKRENIESVSIETQKSFTDGGIARRPDIWVEARDAEGRRHVAIIENKIDSRQGENQLSDYAKILEGERQAKSCTLVYITKYSEETNFQYGENLSFKHLKWFEVYGHLDKEQQKVADELGELPGELLRLMEDWNMDGKFTAAHLRAAVTYFDAGIADKLHTIREEAWSESHIGVFLNAERMPGKWGKKYQSGEQCSPLIQDYGVRLWMGFRFNRRDQTWDVDMLELPSPAVTLSPDGTRRRELPTRPKNWTGPVDSWSENELWVRQPIQGNEGNEMPIYGKPLGACAVETRMR